MHIIRKRHLEGIYPFQLIADNDLLYFITTANNTSVSCYDVKNDMVFSRFTVEALPPVDSFCTLDEHHLYFPTQYGQVLRLQKHSGQILQIIDLGWASIVSGVLCDQQYIYNVCSVPLSNGVKINDKQFCLNTHDKLNGRKIGQSKFFMHNIFRHVVDEEMIWLSSGNMLYKCKKTGEIEQELILTYIPSDHFLTYKDLLILFNNTGLITFINKQDMLVENGMNLKSNNSSPIIVGNNLFWFCHNELIKIDLDTYETNKIMNIAGIVNTNPVIYDNNLIACDSNGDIVQFNTNNQQLYKLTIEKDKWFTPTIINNMAFICSPNYLYQVEINCT